MKKILLWLFVIAFIASAYNSYTERFGSNKCDARNVSGSAVLYLEKDKPEGYTAKDVCIAAQTIVKNHISETRKNFSSICSEVQDLVLKEGGDANAAIAKLRSSGSESANKMATYIDVCFNDAVLRKSSQDVSIYSLGNFVADGRVCKGALSVLGGNIYRLHGFGECESIAVDQHSGNTQYSTILSKKYKYEGKMPESYTFRGVARPF